MTTKTLNPEDDKLPAKVEIDGVAVDYATAVWLVELSEAQGDSPKNIAARILDDVAREDRAAHDEIGGETLH